MKVLTMQDLVGAPGVGDTLPNGATVLDVVITHREVHVEGEYVYGYVLAQRGTEFVSWRLGIRPDRSIGTWSGRYFESVITAVDDFKWRVAGA